ncbi:MAG: 30S ribosome-binding factor RbfA [Anaerolineales bacterium]|nr:30S ribosome-binding factor RbfA [Anaerolineales bacterium]
MADSGTGLPLAIGYPPSAMPTPIRQKRVAEQIRTELSQLLQRELKDPRLNLVTVTRVTIDRELSQADVYVSTLGDEAQRREMLEGLRSAAGFIRRELGRRIQLRNTPNLVFHWDPGLENLENISRLLDELKKDETGRNRDSDDEEA